MGNLTANLNWEEFSCDCKNADCPAKLVAHMPLVLVIQGAADHFKERRKATRVRVDITGGNRCKPHNIDVQMIEAKKTRAEAEASKSTHIDCIAADHKIFVEVGGEWQMVEPKELYDYYDKKFFDSHGVGLYSNRVHIDTRKKKARW